jgi:deoxyadenosine/deoxycytidine kinase
LTIADFTIYKSFVFSEINLPKDEFNIFQKQFEDSIQQLTKPDLIIYLVNNTDEVKKRINQRGRSYELDIEESYLANIEQGYLSFWKQQKDLNVLLIDTSKFNFPYSIEEISSLLNYLKDTEIKGLTAF